MNIWPNFVDVSELAIQDFYISVSVESESDIELPIQFTPTGVHKIRPTFYAPEVSEQILKLFQNAETIYWREDNYDKPLTMFKISGWSAQVSKLCILVKFVDDHRLLFRLARGKRYRWCHQRPGIAITLRESPGIRKDWPDQLQKVRIWHARKASIQP